MRETLELLSVNIGQKRTHLVGNRPRTTGIYKLPTRKAVRITSNGLDADFIGNHRHHGGLDQAVYIYGLLDYQWWSAQLAAQLEPGAFGENLTVTDLESVRFKIGDRLRIGTAILEVSAPRTPCSTLTARMGDSLFAEKFRKAERPGLYCRVVLEGIVQAGEAVTVESFAGDAVSVLEVFREHYHRDKNESRLRRILNSPIAVRVRLKIERDLQKLSGKS